MEPMKFGLRLGHGPQRFAPLAEARETAGRLSRRFRRWRADRRKLREWKTAHRAEAPKHTLLKGVDSGYRPLLRKRDCLRSLVRLHNELVNIWTHLLPALGFAYLAYTELSLHSHDPDRRVIGLYALGGSLMFLASATFHCYSAHSATAHARLLQLDYAGILLQILGSLLAELHFVFHCDSGRFRLFAGTILGLCVLVGALSTLPAFARPEGRALRSAIFGAVVLVGIAPASLQAMAIGDDASELELERRALLWGVPAVAAWYGAGVFFYSLDIPERFFKPDAFAIVGHSHQLMHVLVTVGAIQLYYTTHAFDEFLEAHPSC